MIKIVGNYLSPYVRKVLVCLEAKGLAYEVDPIVPFFGDDRFSKLSPLRRIPVLIDGDLVLYEIPAHTPLKPHHHEGTQIGLVESGTLTYHVLTGDVPVYGPGPDGKATLWANTRAVPSQISKTSRTMHCSPLRAPRCRRSSTWGFRRA